MTYRYTPRQIDLTPAYVSPDQMRARMAADMPWDDRFTPCGMELVFTLDEGTTAANAKNRAEWYGLNRIGERFKAVPYWNKSTGTWSWAVVALY